MISITRGKKISKDTQREELIDSTLKDQDNDSVSNKRARARKRRRSQSDCNNNEISKYSSSAPSHKRRRNECDHENIYIVIDCGPTMRSKILIYSDKTKYELARKFADEMVNRNWKRNGCRKNKMWLYCYNTYLQKICENKKYSKDNASEILQLLDEDGTIDEDDVDYGRCISCKKAIDLIITKIWDNDPSSEKSRIILVTDGERGYTDVITKAALMKGLNENKIVLDCIHLTKSLRYNSTLQELCKDGKYYNPDIKKYTWYLAILRVTILQILTHEVKRKQSF